MLKQAYEFLSQLFTISQRLNKHDEEMREFWRDLRTTSAVSTRLYYDQASIRDEFQRLAERAADELKHQTEREAEARKLFQAQVEIQLLRAGRSLSPAAEAQPVAALSAPSQPDEIALLKTQVIELWAAIRKAEAQRAHDQAEIETLARWTGQSSWRTEVCASWAKLAQ